jgi:hypothetical protein
MTKRAIIENTTKVINLLPEDKASEISDFAEFLKKKYEDQLLTDNIQKIVSDSDAFSFLNDDEDLYSLSDVKITDND